MPVSAEVRPSPIAGTWYSGDPALLAKQVDDYLASARLPKTEGRVIGLIAPHAGHRYSGKTMGHAFRCVKGETRPVVVIFSPYHDYHPAAIITTGHQFYETPLGRVAVASDLLEQFSENLKREAEIDVARVINDREHSLEIELPFLQRTLAGEFQLLPLMIRSHNEWAAKQIGRALAPLLDDVNALLVASTDLSHFYPESIANKLDKEMLHRMEKFSAEDVLNAEQERAGFACGAGAVAAMFCTAQILGANHVEILHYSTSAEQTGDRSQVVGYGAAAVIQRV